MPAAGCFLQHDGKFGAQVGVGSFQQRGNQAKHPRQVFKSGVGKQRRQRQQGQAGVSGVGKPRCEGVQISPRGFGNQPRGAVLQQCLLHGRRGAFQPRPEALQGFLVGRGNAQQPRRQQAGFQRRVLPQGIG